MHVFKEACYVLSEKKHCQESFSLSVSYVAHLLLFSC